jgi:complex iron-sulfur molybdoenzyme family reductase subunit beta
MLWTDRNGADHIWYTVVETRPGKGYPWHWEEKSKKGESMSREDYEKAHLFDYEKLRHHKGRGMPRIFSEINNGPNWDEDIGKGNGVKDAWFFYLPLNCMHCEDPKCIPACPEKAIYKRKDGTVLIDMNLCQGSGECVDACPYKRIFINDNTGKAEKCILCYPRVEKGMPPVCVQTCPGKARFFGDLNDPESPVYKLVKKFKVAVPLYNEFGTMPKIYYIPPVLTPAKIDSNGNPMGERADISYLEERFGKGIHEIKKRLVSERKKKRSELMDLLCSYPTWKI